VCADKSVTTTISIDSLYLCPEQRILSLEGKAIDGNLNGFDA
jgi:hypothetical protein